MVRDQKTAEDKEQINSNPTVNEKDSRVPTQYGQQRLLNRPKWSRSVPQQDEANR
jgi:hypothetical protein